MSRWYLPPPQRGRARHAAWGPEIEGAVGAATASRGVVQRLDGRHHPSDEDIQMFEFLAEIEVPTIVALTKIDKLKPREVLTRVHEIAVALRLEDEQMIPFSAETKSPARRP